MYLTYQYRLNPNASERKSLEAILDQDRWLYNTALEKRKDAYEKNGVSISLYDQQKFLTGIRKGGFNGHLTRQRGALRRLDRAFKAFFRRVKSNEKAGYPRFKGKDRWNSIEIGDQYNVRDNKFVSNDFKDGLRIKMHRPFPDDLIKHCGATLFRRAGKWFVNLKIELPDAEKRLVSSHIGIDVGLNSFLTTSDGRHIENPEHFRRAQKNLRQKQRLLARAKRESKSRIKKKLMAARAFLKIANQRKDFHHKLSKELVDSYDAISAEKLNIRNMVKNRKQSKSISDAGWGLFLNMIAYKAESAGKHFVQVNPRGTSQHCSTCGEKVPKTLSQRTHSCPHCGLVADRDLNAAINIRRLGQSLLPLSHVRPISVGHGSGCPTGCGTEYAKAA